jgi:hypothetical protein
MIQRICNLLKIQQPELNRGLLEASGATVPTDATDGYQVGCIFKHTDGGAETALYVNEGSVTSCDFNPLLTTSFEISDLPDIGTCTYGAGKILVADGDSFEEVAVSGQATLASTGALTIPLLGATAGTVAVSKAVIADAYKTARWGGFNTSAALTDAVPFATVPDTWTDGQLDVFAVFGGSASDLTSAKSAKCIRARHVVNATSIAHESYGIVGQLVVKDTTLTHLHAGIMGTFEGHTSGVVCNGSYTIGQACIMARLGGHASITATDPIAGFLAFNNGAAALASGSSCAFATSMASASYPWTYGLYIPAGSATRGIAIEAVPTSYLLSALSVGAYGTPLVDSVLIDNIAFSVNLSTATNKTAADTSTMAAYIGVSNTGATTNNKLQGLLSSCSVGFNCFDAYAVQGHMTIGAGGVSTQNANAHLTGLSGKAVLTGAVGQGWVTGVLAIVEGAGAVTGLCHVIAGQLEATATDSVCDALLFLGADALATAAIQIVDTAHVTNFLKIEAASGCVVTNALVPAAAPTNETVGADKALVVDVGGTPYYIALYDTLHA